jgi:hypothetical protein
MKDGLVFFAPLRRGFLLYLNSTWYANIQKNVKVFSRNEDQREITMTIAEAAETVLREANGPMHAREIHAQINSRQLFEFKAKDPISVISTVLRKGTQFEKTAPGTFNLRS